MAATPATRPPAPAEPRPRVYFDGDCPVCQREIAFYAGCRGGESIDWCNLARCDDAALGPDLPRDAALARLHARLPDGRLVSGAAAFRLVWSRLPAFRPLAWAARAPGAGALLELGYRGFLVLRRAWRRPPGPRPEWPAWLMPELRTDHAGETGAVMIYRGILATCRDPGVRGFAARHLRTEQDHLTSIEGVVPPAARSWGLPLWKLAGWLTGALPGLAGPRAVYATIDAVETFVDHHYEAQVRRLAADLEQADAPPSLQAVALLLRRCQGDEVAHRDEARQARRSLARGGGRPGWMLRAWCSLVGRGSAAAVAVSRLR